MPIALGEVLAEGSSLRVRVEPLMEGLVEEVMRRE